VRLTDLKAWLYRRDRDEGRRVKVETVGEADGVVFQCPSTRCNHIVAVDFAGRRADGTARGNPNGWHVGGQSVSNLTVDPRVSLTCWHGEIKNGEVL
jgi:hypothetical protein